MDLKIINYSLSPLPLLSFALIIMKEVYSIESKEKKIFQYLFFELWLIVFTIYSHIPGVPPTKKKSCSKVAKFEERKRFFLRIIKYYEYSQTL